MLAGHLLLPRGTWAGVRARLRDAGTRLTPTIKITAVAAATVFAVAGGWIYYNTNILNEYLTREVTSWTSRLTMSGAMRPTRDCPWRRRWM